MEKNILNVFYAIVVFAIVAMVTAVILVINCDISEDNVGNWLSGFITTAFAMVFVSGVACFVCASISKIKNEELKNDNDASKKSKDDEEKKKDEERQKELMKHQEKLALIKQLGKDASTDKAILTYLDKQN